MSAHELADPFAVTADPAAYVPRPESERVLAALEQALRAGRGPCALTGPVGIGKSLLLRVLEERLGSGCECVVLPYAALGLGDLCRWALGLLDVPLRPGQDPEDALRARAERVGREGRALVLMLDDASALEPAAARALAGLSAASAGGLRLLLVPVDDGRAGRVLAALGPELVEVRYRAPLSEAESATLLHERLARAGAPDEVVHRFDGETLARLHAASAGNPRRLQMLAAGVLRGGVHVDPLELAHDELGDGPLAGAGAGAGTSTLRDLPPDAWDQLTDADAEAEEERAERSRRAVGVAIAVVAFALALVALAWWLSPESRPAGSGAGAAAGAPPPARSAPAAPSGGVDAPAADPTSREAATHAAAP